MILLCAHRRIAPPTPPAYAAAMLRSGPAARLAGVGVMEAFEAASSTCFPSCDARRCPHFIPRGFDAPSISGYSTISTTDNEGNPVVCERLLLPFGANQNVEQIVVSPQLAGKPEGRDQEFYHQAEKELRDAEEDKSSPLRTPDNL
jgi:hypothetical protein